MTKEIRFKDLSPGVQAILILCFIFTIAILMVCVIYEARYKKQIDDILNKDLAYWECHNETTTKNLSLPVGYSADTFCASYEGEAICEDGVKIYEFLGEVCNWGDEPKICLIKITEEVCEVK